MVPREGLKWFEKRETPSQIVITNRHHLRHSEAYANAFGCPVRCSAAGLHEFRRGPKVEGFAFGEELAPGITAHQLGAICPDDTAIHIRTAGDGALAFAGGLTRLRGGGLAFVPGFLMGDDPSAVRVGLRESLGRLRSLLTAAEVAELLGVPYDWDNWRKRSFQPATASRGGDRPGPSALSATSWHTDSRGFAALGL